MRSIYHSLVGIYNFPQPLDLVCSRLTEKGARRSERPYVQKGLLIHAGVVSPGLYSLFRYGGSRRNVRQRRCYRQQRH